jgi:hypothetical protein
MRSRYFIILVIFLTAAFTCANAQTPIGLMKNYTTFVPIRYLAEWFGAKVGYNSTTHLVTITYGTHHIALKKNERTVTIDRKKVTQKTAPFERNYTTYVPLRLISEAFTAKVIWDGAKQCVTVVHPTKPGQKLIIQVRHIDEIAVLLREQLRPNVKIIPSNGAFKVVSASKNSLVLSGKVPTLKQDDILVDENGEGILCRVVGVDEIAQGKVLVRTLPAGIIDLFANAEFSLSMPYTPPGGSGWKTVKTWKGKNSISTGTFTVLGSVWQVSLETATTGRPQPDDVVVLVYDRAGNLKDRITRVAGIVTHQYRGPGQFSLQVVSKGRNWTLGVQEVR